MALHLDYANIEKGEISEMGASATLKDYYAILGVSKDATFEEIKKAFRDKAKKYHPDVCKLPDAHERFIEIGEAYEILGNPDTRREYDEFLKYASQNGYNTYDDYSYSDFGQAQQRAKAQAESYARMSLEDLIVSVLDMAFEMGKQFFVGDDDKPELTFRDWVSLGFQGILLTIAIIMCFSGVGTIPGIMIFRAVIYAIEKDGKFIGIGPLIKATIIADLLVIGILVLIFYSFYLYYN